ncbi:hypothetical protein [Acidithiobacillus sp.]|uniref:hypothetical protein n=1 Tax=Acidithiobacillus sp. TaxID=1872118 RepID=UPI00261E60DB|nr:hypothetical protein [Acidithiobacillus sp.]MDD2750951.1 hypothetical protein [Acidithiobacillus sp.]MDD5280726.1 hypothetical protein [Acidithiobacillus sp.]
MDKVGFFVFIVLMYAIYLIMFRKRKTMDFFRAARYWFSMGMVRRPGSAEERALRYLAEVYGSGIYLLWVNRLLAGFGILGCLAAFIVLANELCSLYFAPAALSPYWLDMMALVMLIGVFLPIGVMVFGKWQKTISQRRLGAAHRIFGNLDRAADVANGLRNQYPNASDTPTTWAFPIHPDYAAFEVGKPFLYAYAAIALSSLYVAHTAFRFGETLFLAFCLYFVPVVFHGVLTAFGGWNQKRQELMDYPVSVFLRDIRMLENQRKLLSF